VRAVLCFHELVLIHLSIHGKVFGGYLMRLAYELSYTSASLFAREPVRFFSLDKIAFAKPVPVGSILRLTAHVLHAARTRTLPILLVRLLCRSSRFSTATDLPAARRCPRGRSGRQDGCDGDDE
jgi:hypothetical protein